MMKRFALAAILLVAVLGACSGRSGVGSPAPGASDSVSAGGNGSPTGPSGGKGGSTQSGPSGSPTSSQEPSPGSTDGVDKIRSGLVRESPDDPQPKGCTFRRGERCHAELRGRYLLESRPKGVIRLMAWADGRTSSARTNKLPVPGGDAKDFYITIDYTIPASARTVTFRADLLSLKGDVLAKGEPITVAVLL